MHEALWEFPEGGGSWKKSLPLGRMDIFCNYTLREKSILYNIVTCDVQFFNLLSPGSVHVIHVLLAKCQQLGRCLADNAKRPKSKIIEINSKEEEQAKLTSAHR